LLNYHNDYRKYKAEIYFGKGKIYSMKGPFLKTLDFYFIKKFMGTFLYSIALIVSIAIVFDISENLDEFLSKDASFHDIFVDYYLNFIPYFANLFSSLFTFISVIYFTSKLASDTEIIAILSSGVSFPRLMRPYMVSALMIALFTYTMGNFVIPPANQKRIEFKNKYFKNGVRNYQQNIHSQLVPGTYIYMKSYNTSNDVGYQFTMEKFEKGKLSSKLESKYIKWDRENKTWVIHDYVIRKIDAQSETLTSGAEIDTTLNMKPEDYRMFKNIMETMTLPKLNSEIKELKMKGISTTEFEIEKYRRLADSFASFILTLIGASLASKKVKGGVGMHLGLGILISFSYILFMQISTVFASSGSIPPAIAVWIPNIIFGVLAVYLYRGACRR